MKYSININQVQIVKLAPKMTLAECAVLDYLIVICSSVSDKLVRIERDKEYFTWVDLRYLLDKMPLLHLKSVASASEKVNKLKKYGFIRTIILRRKGVKKLYISLTDKTKSLFFEANTPIRNDVKAYSPRRIDNNNNDNNNKDTIAGASPAQKKRKKRDPLEKIDLDKEIQKIINDPQRHIHIIGLWLGEYPPSVPTYGALQASIKRYVRIAKSLEGYPDRLILDAIDYVGEDGRDRKYDPTLETVLKKINLL